MPSSPMSGSGVTGGGVHVGCRCRGRGGVGRLWPQRRTRRRRRRQRDVWLSVGVEQAAGQLRRQDAGRLMRGDLPDVRAPPGTTSCSARAASWSGRFVRCGHRRVRLPRRPVTHPERPPVRPTITTEVGVQIPPDRNDDHFGGNRYPANADFGGSEVRAWIDSFTARACLDLACDQRSGSAELTRRGVMFSAAAVDRLAVSRRSGAQSRSPLRSPAGGIRVRSPRGPSARSRA
jgi:hypothetical protein